MDAGRKKLPIAIDARTAHAHFPGIGRYVASLAGAMQRLDADRTICLICRSTEDMQSFNLPPTRKIPCRYSPFSIGQQWVVPGLLKRERVALYHSPYYMMPVRPGVPTVLTFHDAIPLVDPYSFGVVQRFVFRIAAGLALEAASCVIVASHAAAADLERYFHVQPQRVAVIPHGVEGRFSARPPGELESMRKKYVLPEKYVLYVGMNKPHKNLARLVEAWGKINADARLTDYALAVGGYWDRRYPEAKMLVERFGIQEKVLFLGPVEEADLPALYTGATLFVFPSLLEGFGFPVLEAMACGVPVACSNRSSLPEVAGEAAAYFNPADPGDMAGVIAKTLRNEPYRRVLSETGLERSSQFTWEKTARQTLACYDRVLDRHAYSAHL
jgi:alpha-1,3-rhamnosyl/mannosyltransferase